jgi:hypothetical protein
LVHAAIDVTQMHIMKCSIPFARDDYSDKSKFYSMQLQAIIKDKMRFIDVPGVGLFIRNLNDVHWVIMKLNSIHTIIYTKRTTVYVLTTC